MQIQAKKLEQMVEMSSNVLDGGTTKRHNDIVFGRVCGESASIDQNVQINGLHKFGLC